MTTPETLSKLVEQGIPHLVNSVKAVPADKLDWKPEPTVRSIREVFTEAATMLQFSADLLNTRNISTYETLSAQYADLSIEELIAQLETGKAALFAAYQAFPEADYDTTIDLPWGTMSFFECMSYPYWNMMWHTGQINYVQTLYGDGGFY